MRAINHALSGALIGLTIGQPLVAVPVAVASHYVLDAIPHHGEGSDYEWIRTKTFRRLIYMDAALCTLLVIVLAARHPLHWLIAAICAFAAAAPDFLSINFYRHVVSHASWKAGPYKKFASAIQWFERPIGAIVEIVWLAGMLLLLTPFLT